MAHFSSRGFVKCASLFARALMMIDASGWNAWRIIRALWAGDLWDCHNLVVGLACVSRLIGFGNTRTRSLQIWLVHYLAWLKSGRNLFPALGKMVDTKSSVLFCNFGQLPKLSNVLNVFDYIWFVVKKYLNWIKNTLKFFAIDECFLCFFIVDILSIPCKNCTLNFTQC